MGFCCEEVHYFALLRVQRHFALRGPPLQIIEVLLDGGWSVQWAHLQEVEIVHELPVLQLRFWLHR